MMINEARSFQTSDLLQHASDADGDTLQVANIKASVGHVIATPTGDWLYIPAFNNTSVVELRFDIKDAEGSVSQKAYLPVTALAHAPLKGTDGDDELTVDPIVTVISHIVEAGGGDDTIRTGAGDDIVFGGDGDDFIYSGAGNDVIYAGTGNDTVYAGDGDDIIEGEDGDDTLYGEAGNDKIDGGAGDDYLWGGPGDDTLTGGVGEDKIEGGVGNDRILAETGDGVDEISVGSGDDTYVAAEADGAESVHGGEGNDTYYAASRDVPNDQFVYDPPAEPVAETEDRPDAKTAAAAETDVLISVENVIGGSGDDLSIASDTVNEFTGGGGDDIFVFQTVTSSGKERTAATRSSTSMWATASTSMISARNSRTNSRRCLTIPISGNSF